LANIFNSISHQIVAQIQQPICLLLLQILLILVTSRVFGLLFSKFKQPAVIGEIVAGIFLGLSVFGNLFPHLFNFIFPTNSFNNLEVLSKIGLAFFMFIIGMELDLVALRKRAKSAFIISISSILIPLLLGIFLAYYLYTSFSMPNVRFSIFALFMGISLSITAFPVLARIVKARGMQKTELGTLALSAAAIADVIAWCLLAMMIALAKAGDFSIGLFTILSAIGYILAMFFIIRPFINNMIARLRSAHYGDQSIVLLSFILLLSSAFTAEIIGIHMLFGAFLAGVIIPQNEKLKHALTSKLEDVSELFLLPIFFAFTGLRLQISLLNTPYLWLISLLVIAMAMIGKFAGTTIPAKLTGMNWKDSFSLGAFMNTRGLMELVVLNIGYELHILSPELFAILVIMAILTTIITSPLLDLIEYLFKNKNLG